MASVTQCDVCKNVVRHNEAKDVRINRLTASNGMGSLLHEVELCPACYDKLCIFLKVRTENDNAGTAQVSS